MIVLGLNLSHDTSVCLIKDGVFFALEEERFSKIKHNTLNRDKDSYFPVQALKQVLIESATSIDEIEHIVASTMSMNYRTGDIQSIHMPEINKTACLLNHHKAHVLSGYLLSGFEEAVCLCIDGAGSLIGGDINTRERVTAWYLNRNKTIQRIYSCGDKIKINSGKIIKQKGSLGNFYLNFAELCIPRGDEAEGSLMALAAYSSDEKYYPVIRDLIKLLPNGLFEIENNMGAKIEGRTLQIGSYIWNKSNVAAIPFNERIRLAYAVQRVFEETVLHILNYICSVTNIKNIVFVGGCALNSKLNGVITNKTGFKNLYVPPAPNDAGIAVGAALYAWNIVEDNPFFCPPINVNWGNNINVEYNYIRERYSTFEVNLLTEDELYAKCVMLLKNNKVIAWCRDRMEFGPRSLGYRSLIGAAVDVSVRHRINKIKQRASFRPLAPSVLAAYFNDFFTGEADCYMNKVAYVNSKKIPGVTHVDGSARVQLVHPSNPFHSLLTRYYAETGIPLILNTSLNRKGKPIASSIKDVLDVFDNLDIDACVIDNIIIIRK